MMITLNEDFHFDFDDSDYVAKMDALIMEDEYRADAMAMTMNELRRFLDDNMYGDHDVWKIYYSVYQDRDYQEQQKFFNENFADFTAYENKLKEDIKNGVPVDLAFYSDWHKDMYGYRPRYEWMRKAIRIRY